MQDTHVQKDWTGLSDEIWSIVFSNVKAMLEYNDCVLAAFEEYQEELLGFYNVQRYLYPDTIRAALSLILSRTVSLAQCMPKVQNHLCAQLQLLLHLACA